MDQPLSVGRTYKRQFMVTYGIREKLSEKVAIQNVVRKNVSQRFVPICRLCRKNVICFCYKFVSVGSHIRGTV